MFRFMQRLGRDSETRGRGTGPLTRARRRNHRLDCEALESRQLLAGFYIVNVYSGKVLDDPGASPNNFAVIDQYQLNGAGNQRWDLLPVGNGNYEIRNEASGLVLDNSFSTTEGTVIDQFQPYGDMNQQWQLFEQQRNGPYGFRNAYSKLVLGDPGFSTSEGTQVVQWQWTSGLNEQWYAYASPFPEGLST